MPIHRAYSRVIPNCQPENGLLGTTDQAARMRSSCTSQWVGIPTRQRNASALGVGSPVAAGTPSEQPELKHQDLVPRKPLVGKAYLNQPQLKGYIGKCC